uniref:Myomesin 3 n=1 Tax=Latimeria chalumnae TaxID=7897 RepID=H3B841_LATCH
ACPSAPYCFTLLSCGKDEMVLGWKPPKFKGGAEILGYFLDQREVSERVWHEVNSNPISTKIYKIENLKEGHFYEFRACAMNLAGVGELSHPSDQFKCEEWTMPEPGPAFDVTVSEVRRNSLLLQWESPVYTGKSAVTGYRAEISEMGSDEWKVLTENPTADKHLRVLGLEEGKCYIFRVCAINAAGAGPPSAASDPVIAETKPGTGTAEIEVGVDNDGVIFLAFEPPEPSESCQCTWMKDYQEITQPEKFKIETEEKGSQLTFANPTKEDLGTYSVTVSDPDEASASYKLTEEELERLLQLSHDILNPLINLKSDWAVEMLERGTVRLWLQVEELSPAAELRLVFNEKEMASTSTHKINFDRSKGLVEIIISDFTMNDEGSYTAQLKDGRAKNQFTLVLIDDQFKQILTQAQLEQREWKRKQVPGPYFLEQLQWKVTEDCRVLLTCKITNTKKETCYKWFKDETELPQVEFQPQTGVGTFVIPQVTDRDMGVYKATLTDARGEDTSILQFTDTGFEDVLKEVCRACALSASPLKVRSTAEGIRIFCSMKYYLDYMKKSWSYKEKALQSDARRKSGSAMDQVWLEILNPSMADMGKYTLELFDGKQTHQQSIDLSGAAFEDAMAEYQRLKQAAIAEKNRAKVLQGLPDVVTIMEDKTLCLKCHVSGDPTPEVYWLRNDREVVPSDHFQMKTEGTANTLTIKEVKAEDSGKYSVFVKNKYGSETGTVTLSVYLHGEEPEELKEDVKKPKH